MLRAGTSAFRFTREGSLVQSQHARHQKTAQGGEKDGASGSTFSLIRYLATVGRQGSSGGSNKRLRPLVWGFR